ncbi:hypothetical protein CH371_20120 [Leptospira wolffii]|uniref:DUF4393 domain-containing protein n=1 Tax=Leptospira wolffii TaxID=409998 RepID=A0A2M9Z6M0_9LEPT|nr:hypothetical protein [Leptospira wolffii]PJZ64065.1 hypothetical protein CH371_20120 [Leptospira wolffii]
MNIDPNETAKQSAIGLVRGALGAVPYVGTLLIETIFDTRSRIKLARLNRFFELFAELLNRKTLMQIPQHASDEFSDLLENILGIVVRTRSDDRLRLYSAIVHGNLNSDTSQIIESEIFTNILASLTEFELILLTKLHATTENLSAAEQHPDHRGIKPVHINKEDTFILGLATSDFLTTFDILISKGLVHDDGIGRLGAPYREFIAITSVGQKLMDFVEKFVEEKK